MTEEGEQSQCPRSGNSSECAPAHSRPLGTLTLRRGIDGLLGVLIRSVEGASHTPEGQG